MSNKNNRLKIIDILYKKWAGEEFQSIVPLPSSGSYREYYRITGNNGSVLGVYNEDIEENIAFITYSEHFTQLGLNVPRLHIVAEDKISYIIEDLGDTTLFKFIENNPLSNPVNLGKAKFTYFKVIDELLRIQLNGVNGLDLSVAFPRAAFDEQSIMWDLNYFKYYFVKLFKVQFHEQRLENDFHQFASYLLTTNCNYFLFRDFQSRNIMLCNDKVFLIDYQGGRKGALQYDLASLLYEAKVNLPDSLRNELFQYYIDQISKHVKIEMAEFTKMYNAYVLIRMMQAMGAYGFRGIIERKQLFIDSIPPTIKNLEKIIKEITIIDELKELKHVFNQIVTSEIIKNYTNKQEC